MLTSRSNGGRAVTSAPPRKTRPAVGSSKPAIIRSTVVLPEPDGPSIEKNSPSRISRSRSSTAVTDAERLRDALQPHRDGRRIARNLQICHQRQPRGTEFVATSTFLSRFRRGAHRFGGAATAGGGCTACPAVSWSVSCSCWGCWPGAPRWPSTGSRASGSTCAAAPRSSLETQDSPTVEGRRRVHRPGGRGAAPPGRRARRRRAHPDPVRRRRIIVELPGVQDPREAAEVDRPDRAADLPPGASGHRPPRPTPSRTEAAASWSCPTRTAASLGLGPAARPARASTARTPVADPQGRRLVRHRRLQRPRAPTPSASSPAAAACAAGRPARRVAIVLDDQVISSPQVDPVPCDVGIAGGRPQITGNFTSEEAKDLAVLIGAARCRCRSR